MQLRTHLVFFLRLHTNDDLRRICYRRALSSTGNKVTLVKRLLFHLPENWNIILNLFSAHTLRRILSVLDLDGSYLGKDELVSKWLELLPGLDWSMYIDIEDEYMQLIDLQSSYSVDDITESVSSSEAIDSSAKQLFRKILPPHIKDYRSVACDVDSDTYSHLVSSVDTNDSEDAVKSKFIEPFLYCLGFKEGLHIERERKVTYGTFRGRKKQEYAIPDYAIKVNNQYQLIVEVKNPRENIHKVRHVKQLFSYARADEIYARYLILSNGKELSLYFVHNYDSNTPLVTLKVSDMESWFPIVFKFVSLKSLENTIGFYHYTLFEEIGRGGVGIVYKAWNNEQSRFEAVKVLHSKHHDDSKVVERFFRSKRTVQRINHPCTINIYESKELSGCKFLSMELFRGQSLRTMVDSPLSIHDAIKILHPILCAVKSAHQVGILHRDLKPSNILCRSLSSGEFVVKIADFDLAFKPDETALTTHLSSMGSRWFSAPEFYHGNIEHCNSPKVDIFSVGAIFYFLLFADNPPYPVSESNVLKRLKDGNHMITKPLETLANLIASSCNPFPENRLSSIAYFIKTIEDVATLLGLDLLENPFDFVKLDVMLQSEDLCSSTPDKKEKNESYSSEFFSRNYGLSYTISETVNLFSNGSYVSDISKDRGLAESTIKKHLMEGVRVGAIPLYVLYDYLGLKQTDLFEIKSVWDILGKRKRLRKAFEHLKGEYSYDVLGFVFAHFEFEDTASGIS